MLRRAPGLTLADRSVLVSAALAVVHYVDHLLRLEDVLWPPRFVVLPLTIGLLVYPVLVKDPLHLFDRPWLRVILSAGLAFNVFALHFVTGSVAEEYNAWISGEFMGIRSPVMGMISVHVTIILVATSMFSFVLVTRQALRTSMHRSRIGPIEQ